MSKSKPTHYINKPITLRVPRNESFEAIVKADEKTVVGEIGNNQDKIFEIPRLLIKLTALADGLVTDPQPSVLDRLVKIGLSNLGMNERIASTARQDSRFTSGLPLRHVADTTFEWLPETPIALLRGDALMVEITPRESFQVAWRGERRAIDAIRVEITLDGDNCHLGLPAEAAIEAPLG